MQMVVRNSGVARLSWLPGLSEVITRLNAKHVVVRGV